MERFFWRAGFPSRNHRGEKFGTPEISPAAKRELRWMVPRASICQMNAMETMLAAVADSFDTNALKALVEMRAPEEAAKRMDWLAERANEGLLTEDERHEYQSAVSFGNFLGLLQSKARLKLKSAA